MPDPSDPFQIKQSLREHLDRAALFLKLAAKHPKSTDAFRLCVAAAYSAVAATDQVLDHAKREQPEGREAITQAFISRIRRYSLLCSLRVQDYHRRALFAPDPNTTVVQLFGPITLTARQKGGAAIWFDKGGIPRSRTTKNSSVKMDRPIVQRDFGILDDESGAYVHLGQIVVEFREDALREAMNYEKLMSPNPGRSSQDPTE